MITAWVRKEIKEYVVYALVAAVFLAALAAYLLYVGRTNRLGLVGDTFLMTMAVAFALVGLALALVSTLADLRRGHFGFAVHRPARRWTIYLAKFLGLAVLYAVATTPAVVAAAACAADARYVQAPFAAAMLQPLLFWQAGGLVWVAVGMLIAARQARWSGSRLFPAVVGIAAVALGGNAVSTFGPALMILAAGVLVAWLAGAAYFAHNGEYASQPLWGRVLSGLIVLGMSAAVVGSGLNVAAEAVRTAGGGGGSYFLTAEYDYGVGADGQPYRYRRSALNGNAPFATLDGKPLTPKDTDWVNQHGITTTSLQVVDPESVPGARHPAVLDRQNYLQNLTAYGGPDEPHWWYVPARQIIEGFDAQGSPLGSIGQDGFHPPGEVVRPFPPSVQVLDYAGSYLLLSDAQDVFVVNLRMRDARPVYHGDAADPVCGVAILRLPVDVGTGVVVQDYEMPLAKAVRYVQLVVTKRHTTLFIPLDGRPVVVVPTEPTDGYDFRSVSTWGDANAAVMTGVALDKPGQLIESRNGRIERIELPPRPYKPSDPETPFARWVRQTPGLLAAPPAAVALKWTVSLFARDNLTHSWREIGWVLTPLLLGVGLTFLVVRREARRVRVTWLVLGALLGPTVALAAVCLRDRVARVRCPACGKPRAVDRDHCEHCDAAFPTPGDPATAIFEDARTAA